MPPASVPTLCTFLADATGPDPEWCRVLRIADPGPALDGPLTFAPVAGLDADRWLAEWQAWRDGPCATVLGPAIIAAAGHAGQNRARELQELCLHIQSALEPRAAERGAQAGTRLLRRLGTSRGERWLGKLGQWAEDAAHPAHFAVVYGAQSALFHLPLRLLLPSYAYWEWTAALTNCPPVGEHRLEFAAEAVRVSELAQGILSSRENLTEHAQAVFGGA